MKRLSHKAIKDIVNISIKCLTSIKHYTISVWKEFIKPTNLLSSLGIIATVSMAVIMAIQSISINSQSASLKSQTSVIEKSFVLDKRPYLYVDITPSAGYDKDNNLFAGTIISYRNIGSLVANNINTEVKIADDGDGKSLYDIAGWYKDTFKSYPYVRSVFPQQEIPPIKFTPNISSFPQDKAKLIYVGVRIRYTDSEGRPYSYGVDYTYVLKKISETGFEYTVIKYDTFWDSNKGLPPHSIEAPDWKLYAKGTSK